MGGKEQNIAKFEEIEAKLERRSEKQKTLNQTFGNREENRMRMTK